MKNGSLLITSLAVVFFAILGCEKLALDAPKDDEILDGPMEGLSAEQRSRFVKGDEAFAEVFTIESGLGSIFVAASCDGCHAGDGKGHPFTTLTRFGQSDSTGNQYMHLGGPQIQNRAIPGFTPEQVPAGAPSSNYTPPAVTGLGFLSTITDADILAMSDPNDADGDGISGVPNWIELPPFVRPAPNAITQTGRYIGRFGKKAAAHDLLHQTVNAYNQDMGIASVFDPRDVYTGFEIDPEVSTQSVHDVVFYLRTLKAPVRRLQDDEEALKGEKIFTQIQCGSCHKPRLRTGPSPIEVLSHKEFYPYTDLLLHDMGKDLDDGYTEGMAKTSEWKTPALWGLGLSPNAQGGEYFLMHDGRARSIEEAILLHGGEAENSKHLYKELSATDKEALLKFLESL